MGLVTQQQTSITGPPTHAIRDRTRTRISNGLGENISLSHSVVSILLRGAPQLYIEESRRAVTYERFHYLSNARSTFYTAI